jgi:hypothetical protein
MELTKNACKLWKTPCQGVPGWRKYKILPYDSKLNTLREIKRRPI